MSPESEMAAITIQPIGILHCDLKNRAVTPKNYDESDYAGVIEIYPEYSEGLAGITRGETIVVLFWLHKADRSVLKVHPRGDASRPKRGVFATRSPVRPNPIAVSELTVEDINGNILRVRGLDVFDNTPVIDIKKRINPHKDGQ